MFNGIIFNTGKVKSLKRKKIVFTLEFKQRNLTKTDLGSSICCDGVCLTLDKIVKNKIFFYISDETLKRSNLKNLKLNQLINLKNLYLLKEHFRSLYSRTCRHCSKN